MSRRPLSEGNRLQRAYDRWAQPYYARMAPELRAEAIRLDRWLYSRAGLGLWLGLLGALAGSVAGLTAAGVPFVLALVCSVLACLGMPLAALGAWLQPEKFVPRRLLRWSLAVGAFAYLGGLVGFLVGRFERHGSLQADSLADALWGAARQATPILVVVVLAFMLLMWGVAQARRLHSERELARVTLEQERDAAARQAAEARLKLLQGQIQPHFIFNTLSAVQHWVDSGDARAGPLLRSLTAFLRGSTEALGRDEVTLADEVAMVVHYLAIMQARFGDRLRVAIDVEPEAGRQRLPPGLLLTLVENAVEHGAQPALQGAAVAVSARTDGTRVVVEVHDDGAGLSAASADGVGLANCRQRLAQAFGGQASLRLTGAAGAGCTARIDLPFHPDPRAP